MMCTLLLLEQVQCRNLIIYSKIRCIYVKELKLKQPNNSNQTNYLIKNRLMFTRISALRRYFAISVLVSIEVHPI